MAERRYPRSHGADLAPGARGPLKSPTCTNCGTDLDILKRPIRRLRWTRHWWRGVSSLFSTPLRHCARCGSLYDADGTLVAAGATETEAELKIRRFRNDMIGLRDGFGAVVVGSGLTVAWTLMGPVNYDAIITILAGAIGTVALGPFTYFMMKVRKTKRELKEWRRARQQGGTVE